MRPLATPQLVAVGDAGGGGRRGGGGGQRGWEQVSRLRASLRTHPLLYGSWTGAETCSRAPCAFSSGWEVPLAPTPKRAQVSGAHSLRGPTLPAPLRGQGLTSTIGLDLSPRWSRPAFSGRGRGKGRPWAPAFQSSSADRGPPSPQPGGRGPSPSTDPSPVWSDPLGSRARWPQGTARAAWDTRGAWDPASLWREQKEAKQGSSLLGCHAPALLASSLSGSSSRETGNSPAGLEKATSLRAPATSPLSRVSVAAGTRAQRGGHRVPASPWPP